MMKKSEKTFDVICIVLGLVLYVVSLSIAWMGVEHHYGLRIATLMVILHLLLFIPERSDWIFGVVGAFAMGTYIFVTDVLGFSWWVGLLAAPLGGIGFAGQYSPFYLASIIGMYFGLTDVFGFSWWAGLLIMASTTTPFIFLLFWLFTEKIFDRR